MRLSFGNAFLATATLASFALAPSAQAQVTFSYGNGSIGGGNDQNVLFNGTMQQTQTGNIVFAETQAGGAQFSFTSGQVLSVGGGQATLDTVSGKITSSFTVDVLNNFGLRQVEFAPTPTNNNGDSFSVSATDQFGTVFTSSPVLNTTNGGRELVLATTGPSLIRSFTFNFLGGSFDDVRQFRVDAVPLRTVNVGAVPEPSEWLAMGMAGTSVMGLMIRARRRKSSKSVAA